MRRLRACLVTRSNSSIFSCSAIGVSILRRLQSRNTIKKVTMVRSRSLITDCQVSERWNTGPVNPQTSSENFSPRRSDGAYRSGIGGRTKGPAADIGAWQEYIWMPHIEDHQPDDSWSNPISIVLAYLRHELLADLRRFSPLLGKRGTRLGAFIDNRELVWECESGIDP